MSAIKKELTAATEVEQKRGEDKQDFFARLITAASELKDKEWEKLSGEAQDWVNDGIDAMNEEKDVQDFPDEEEAKEEKPRRRASKSDDKEEAKEEPKKEEVKPYKPKAGDLVSLTTKRGKTVEGKCVEYSKGDDVIVINVDGEDEEYPISTSTIMPGGEPEDEPADEGSEEAEVGDTVTFTTKRGKVITGKVQELTEGTITIETAAGDVDDYALDRIDGDITVKVKGKPATKGKKEEAKEEEKPTRGRRASKSDEKDEPKEEPAEKGKRTRSTNGGVSVGDRIRQLVVKDMEATVEEVIKTLRKEELEFKDATVGLIYADTHKTIKFLREAKLLK